MFGIDPLVIEPTHYVRGPNVRCVKGRVQFLKIVGGKPRDASAGYAFTHRLRADELAEVYHHISLLRSGN